MSHLNQSLHIHPKRPTRSWSALLWAGLLALGSTPAPQAVHAVESFEHHIFHNQVSDQDIDEVIDQATKGVIQYDSEQYQSIKGFFHANHHAIIYDQQFSKNIHTQKLQKKYEILMEIVGRDLATKLQNYLTHGSFDEYLTLLSQDPFIGYDCAENNPLNLKAYYLSQLVNRLFEEPDPLQHIISQVWEVAKKSNLHQATLVVLGLGLNIIVGIIRPCEDRATEETLCTTQLRIQSMIESGLLQEESEAFCALNCVRQGDFLGFFKSTASLMVQLPWRSLIPIFGIFYKKLIEKKYNKLPLLDLYSNVDWHVKNLENDIDNFYSSYYMLYNLIRPYEKHGDTFDDFLQLMSQEPLWSLLAENQDKRSLLGFSIDARMSDLITSINNKQNQEKLRTAYPNFIGKCCDENHLIAKLPDQRLNLRDLVLAQTEITDRDHNVVRHAGQHVNQTTAWVRYSRDISQLNRATSHLVQAQINFGNHLTHATLQVIDSYLRPDTIINEICTLQGPRIKKFVRQQCARVLPGQAVPETFAAQIDVLVREFQRLYPRPQRKDQQPGVQPIEQQVLALASSEHQQEESKDNNPAREQQQ